MTESEWLTSDDPQAMLEWRRYGRPNGILPWIEPITDRQLRLFAVACCRRFPVSGEMEALSVAERFADGLATYEELRTAGLTTVGGGSWTVCFPQVSELVQHLLTDGHFRGQESALCSILRDIIGNPFRPITIDPSWLAWRDGAIPRLAQTAYEELAGRACKKCDGCGQIATYGPPRESHHCGMRMQRREDSGNIRDGHYPVWCPKCWWLCLPEHTGYKPCPDCHGTGTLETGELDPGNVAIIADALEEAGCGMQKEPVIGTPQHLLAHLLDVRKVDVLGGMATHHAGPGRIISDDGLGRLAVALQTVWDRERCFDSQWDTLTLTHWHTGNGHLSSSFTLMNSRAKPGERLAWGIHLKNEVADQVIHEVCGDLLMVESPHSLLAHLRSPDPHVRGCWALDLLTRKG